jgi:plasmid stabilization system protein ParE
MKRLRFRLEAEREIDEAAVWYESRAFGLGEKFLTAVDEAIDAILRNPRALAKVDHGTRRFSMRRFPYGIIYQERGGEILIVSCFHSHRDPKHWHSRL